MAKHDGAHKTKSNDAQVPTIPQAPTSLFLPRA
jgi:hypothetical protein